MNILAIESSCDETSAAIIHSPQVFPAKQNPTPTDTKNDTSPTDPPEILANVVVSQIDIFAEYGGVIPEIAARSHLEAILPVIRQAFSQSGLTWDNIDAIAVTHTPGLLGSLLIGTLTARMLAILHHKPLYAVHHLKSHIYSAWLPSSIDQDTSKSTPNHTSPKLQDTSISLTPAAPASPLTTTPATPISPLITAPTTPTFPLLALVISGGHTQIIYMKKHNNFEIIGTTRDDAVGECFDKVAKILGLPYPGGPAIAQAAAGHIHRSTTPNKPTHHTSTPDKPTHHTSATPDKLTSTNDHDISPGDPHKYRFPHPKLTNPPRHSTPSHTSFYQELSLDFSFSGLKTAVLRTVQKELNKPISFPSHQLAPLLSDQQIVDFAASFQSTAIDILLEQLEKATTIYPVKSLVIAGGVSANQLLRKKSLALSQKLHLPIFFPTPKLSGDNAAMVGTAAYYEILSGTPPTDPYTLNIYPRSPISTSS